MLWCFSAWWREIPTVCSRRFMTDFVLPRSAIAFRLSHTWTVPKRLNIMILPVQCYACMCREYKFTCVMCVSVCVCHTFCQLAYSQTPQRIFKRLDHFTLVKEALIEIGCVVTSLVVGWLVVTRVHCGQTVHPIFEIFSPSGSDTILVFSSQRGCRYSDGNPPKWGVECKGVW